MNEPQPRLSKAVVFAYFAHQATPMERQQIEAWLKTSEGLELYFTYLDEWERQFPQFQANLEQAREKFTAFVHQAERSTISKPAPTPSFPAHLSARQPKRYWPPANSWLSVAATVLLLVGMWFSADSWYYQTWTNHNHQVREILLQDGSEVELAANSSLKYRRFGFDWGTRHVWLNGDAEFKVAHLANAGRFKVHTPDQTVIEVLGTEFVVNSRPKATKVMLKTGSIRLTNPIAEHPVTLEPGDMVTISIEKKIQKKPIGEQPDNAGWRNQQFEFKDTPLKEVARQVYEAYGVKIQITQQTVMNRTISGTFQAETAEDLLEAIAVMMQLEIEEQSDGYLLSQRTP